jgi:hypothetical protein
VSKGVIVFVDDGDDLNFARTDDKGATWNTTQIEFGTVRQVACWYDKETPGDSGTLVHVVWINDTTDDVFYITIDVSDGSTGTKRTVDGTITASALHDFNRIAITKTVSGNLIVAFFTPSDVECYKSDDGFATAPTDIADVFEDERDWCLLFPAATADDNDACAMFWDISANEITLKMYDDSANTWTEFGTPIAATAVESTFRMNMDGAVRHSDSHVLVSWHSDEDDAGDDLQTADLTVDDITTPTITAKTNVVTDQAESGQVAVWINQQTDEVRIAYLKGGTWIATVDVVFHISGDGMGSWGSEQAYSESAADDFRLVHGGRTVGDAGGRYQPSFYDDDDLIIYINETNDTEIAAAVALTVGEMMAARMMGPPMTPPVPAEVVAY